MVQEHSSGQAGPSCPCSGHYYNLEDIWVLDRILEFCERMGLAMEGNETKLFEFLAAAEAIKKKAAMRVDKEVEVGEVWDRTVHHGG